MANISELAEWVSGIFRWELTTQAEGGEDGDAVLPIKQLANRTSYLKSRVDGLESGAIAPTANAGGTANAITASITPSVAALVDGISVCVRAAAANTSATPTFSLNGLTARTIVRGNGQSLIPGDIAGAGHWLSLTYDATLVAWVLGNPAGDMQALKAANGWVRLGSGIIVQWGSATGAGAGNSVTFQIAFPTGCLFVTGANGDTAANISAVVSLSSWSTSAFNWGSNSASSTRINWIAVGH